MIFKMQGLTLMFVILWIGYLNVAANNNCSTVANKCFSCGYIKPECQCLNGGICNEINGSCKCVATFTGKFCENRVVCDQPESIPNLTWNIKSKGIGDVITASCEDGYQLIGHNQRRCLSTGTWAPAAPICKIKCGLPRPTVDLKEVKWHAAIFKLEYSEWRFKGSASLISDRWLITAALFVSDNEVRKELDASTFKIYIGITSKNINTLDEANAVKYSIKKFVIHPNYHLSSYDSNIALIELKSKVNLSENLFPVCLPPALDKFNTIDALDYDLKPDMEGIVSGWGILKTLHNITVVQIDRQTCRREYTRYNLSLTANMFCGQLKKCPSYGDDINCAADIGSPLVAKDAANKWILHGIVSGATFYCGCHWNFMIFVNVAQFTTWIKACINVE